MKKSILIGLSTTAVTLGIVGMAGLASAQTSSTSLVDKIAAKFGLNKTDVQAVFDEDKTEMQAERKAEMSERLQALVDKGTITADQKTKIEAKQTELQTARDAERSALETWATDNGIDAKYLRMGGRDGGDSSTELQALVDKGTITADQKTKIEAKQTELKTARESSRTELEKWATDNGIDAKYLMMGGGGHGGPGGPGGRF